MGIKNKDGETPGQILGWGPPWDSAEEEEDEEVSKEREWQQKLQGELEDEWQEVIGRFEGKEPIATPAACLPSPTPLYVSVSVSVPSTPKSQPLSNTLIPPPKQMMPPGTHRSPSPSQHGQSA